MKTTSNTFSYADLLVSPIPTESIPYCYITDYTTTTIIPSQWPTTAATVAMATTTNTTLLPQTTYAALPTYSAAATPLKQLPIVRTRGRRVSNVPNDNCSTRSFACKTKSCNKVFKRAEHLKRHIRSIHTMEKPFKCPYQSCNKQFSRSDNLNQHIRIHRHCTATTGVQKSSPSLSTSSSVTTDSSSTALAHLYSF